MRIFADATGREWTVYEVKKQGDGPERWSYLPDQFGDGWLCFESEASKRRLTPIPRQWRDSTDSELVRMLNQAQAVVRSRAQAEDRPSAE